MLAPPLPFPLQAPTSPPLPDSRGNSSQRAPTTPVQVTPWMAGIRLTLSHPARAPQRLRILGSSQARGEGLELCGSLDQGPWLGELTWLVSRPWSASASAFQSETLSQSVVPAMCQGGSSSGDKAVSKTVGVLPGGSRSSMGDRH